MTVPESSDALTPIIGVQLDPLCSWALHVLIRVMLEGGHEGMWSNRTRRLIIEKMIVQGSTSRARTIVEVRRHQTFPVTRPQSRIQCRALICGIGARSSDLGSCRMRFEVPCAFLHSGLEGWIFVPRREPRRFAATEFGSSRRHVRLEQLTLVFCQSPQMGLGTKTSPGAGEVVSKSRKRRPWWLIL
jgi:hypothetical protein